MYVYWFRLSWDFDQEYLALSFSLPCLFESLASFVKLHFISISYVTHSIGQMYTHNLNRTGACYLVSMT